MEKLKPYRERIDALDDQIIALLGERHTVIQEVGHFKAHHNIPVILADRVDEVRERCAKQAEKRGIDPDFIRTLYTNIINYSCKVEDDIIRRTKAK